ERLGFPAQHPEGRFFPDTYHFSSGQTDLSVLANAHSAMRQYLDAAWLHRAPQLPYESPDEALIMASIVEKETGAAHERPAIAGVFVRRLRKNMRLQTDPTVIYGLGERFDGNLRRRDLREDTPYNTYVHKGLPPTPIANPGGAAVDAALHPLKGTALYFVAKGNGTHKFSDTYAQHKRAVALYQLKRKGTGS
ncbi:MAG: endolytic transglycosylase MltG, partial [Chromatiales bacterium]|nr:endolytic transglycosylase MltG [Chromatiales bacterium]